MEGDKFQTYGRRRINVSICNVLHYYFKNEDTFEPRYLEMIAHKVEVPLLLIDYLSCFESIFISICKLAAIRMQKGYPHVKTQMPHIFQGTAKTCFEHIYCSKIASHCCTVCYNSLKSAHSSNSQYNHNYLEMAFKK